MGEERGGRMRRKEEQEGEINEPRKNIIRRKEKAMKRREKIEA